MKVIKVTLILGLLQLFTPLVNCEFGHEELRDVQCSNHFATHLCDCQFAEESMTLRPFIGSIRELVIQNCKNFFVQINLIRGFESLSLVYFKNIANLVIDEFSFNSTNFRPPIGIHFVNVNTSNIPSNLVRGNIRDISFDQCTVEKIHSFAFAAISGRINSITLANSEFIDIDPMIFRKIIVDNLVITNSTFFNPLPSKTFYDCQVKTLRIENSTFIGLNSRSLSFNEVETLRILSNGFDTISGEAFVMKISKYVDIRNNFIKNMQVSAFSEIIVNYRVFTQQTEPVNFDFNSNHIETIFPNPNVLFARDFNLRISDIYIDRPLSCDEIRNAYEYDFIKEFPDRIYVKGNDDNFESIYIWHKIKCVDHNLWFMILLIVLGCLVFLTIMTVFICCCCWRRRKAKKLVYVVPEPKTYRETVIVTQIENHGLLRTDL